MNGDGLPICKIVKRIKNTISGYGIRKHGLKELRKKIDKQDSELIDLLKRRTNTSIEIAKIKKDKNIPIYDPRREKKILKKAKHKGREKGLDEKHIENVFSEVLRYSKERMRSVRRLSK